MASFPYNFSHKTSFIGGPSLSKDRLLEKRIREQKRAEALEKSKVYEKKV